MKYANGPFLSCLSIAIILFSCKKTHESTHNTSTAPADSTTHIDYIYLAGQYQENSDSVRQIELILNDQSGNLLLDTIAAVNTNIVADIHTTSKAVDMTVISYQAQMHEYYITTNKAINPAAWTLLPGSDSLLGIPPAAPAAFQWTSIDYTNVPSGQAEIYDWYAYSNNAVGLVNVNQNNLNIPYDWSAGTYAYLLFPDLALYNLHQAENAAETVDLSVMDTAEKVKFMRGSYPALEGYLDGYPDTTNTNLASSLEIAQFGPGLYSPSGADIVYPGKRSFQKYFASMTFANNDLFCVYTDPWCDSVNPNPLLLDSSYYTITSSSNNNFSVQFNKQTPGYYTIVCTGGMYWTLNVPPDSTVIHPVTYLSSLKSKMLAAQNLNAIGILSFSFFYQVIQNKLVPASLSPGGNSYQTKPQNIPFVTLSTNL